MEIFFPYPSNMAGSFVGYNSLRCPWSFRPQNTLFWVILAFKVFIEKLAIILMGFLYMWLFFSLVVFNTLVLFCIFSVLTFWLLYDIIYGPIYLVSYVPLYLYGFVLPQFVETFFCDLVEYLIYSINLKFFSFISVYNLKTESSHNVPHFLHVWFPVVFNFFF